MEFREKVETQTKLTGVVLELSVEEARLLFKALTVAYDPDEAQEETQLLLSAIINFLDETIFE